MDDPSTYGRRIVVLAVRDVSVIAFTGLLMHADSAMRGQGVLANVVAVLTGFFITVSGFYAHEWGHYLAGRFGGARPIPSASPISVYLFKLEEDMCTRSQWLTMSMGGYVATILALPVILAIIDVHALSGQVALVLTGLGVLATFGLEIPITLRVYRKAEPSNS